MVCGVWLQRKTFGQPIQYWGNLDSVKGRKAYPKLREFIFTALIARTDIDFIALEKGEMTSRKAVDMLMQTMEEYANWGFHFMEDKLIDNPNHFFRETAFLEVFLAFDASVGENVDNDEPEPLDWTSSSKQKAEITIKPRRFLFDFRGLIRWFIKT